MEPLHDDGLLTLPSPWLLAMPRRPPRPRRVVPSRSRSAGARCSTKLPRRPFLALGAPHFAKGRNCAPTRLCTSHLRFPPAHCHRNSLRTNGNYRLLLREALCVTNGQVLHTAVGVVYERGEVLAAPGEERHLQRRQGEVGP